MHPECRLEWLSYDAKAMDLQLNDKVAIVTGSSRGIGLAIAHALAAEGCRITLCARTEARLRQAASEVEQTAGRAGRVLAVGADVSTEAGAGQVVARTVETFGGVDVVVNNVSMAGGRGLLDTSDALLDLPDVGRVLIEPLLIVFLGVVVGGIVMAMFLPIFQLGAVAGGLQ